MDLNKLKRIAELQQQADELKQEHKRLKEQVDTALHTTSVMMMAGAVNDFIGHFSTAGFTVEKTGDAVEASYKNLLFRLRLMENHSNLVALIEVTGPKNTTYNLKVTPQSEPQPPLYRAVATSGDPDEKQIEQEIKTLRDRIRQLQRDFSEVQGRKVVLEAAELSSSQSGSSGNTVGRFDTVAEFLRVVFPQS